jgi:flagellar biosynthetic protein FliR
MFPFFNSRVIPVLSKTGLALITTIVLFPVVGHKVVGFPESSLGLFALVTAEFVIGMTLGLLIQIFFEGVRMMGQLVGFQTGFAITNILDPQSGVQISILSNTSYLVAMVLFLVFNGHHVLIGALKESFEIINFGSLSLDEQAFNKIIPVFGDMFLIAIKIGAPAIAALLFTKVVFGLITRLMPQMNIMIVAFPVQVFIGLFFFGVCLNTLLVFLERYVGNLGALLMNTMALIKG